MIGQYYLATAVVVLRYAPAECLCQGPRQIEHGVCSPDYEGPEAGRVDVVTHCTELPFPTLQLFVHLTVPGQV